MSAPANKGENVNDATTRAKVREPVSIVATRKNRLTTKQFAANGLPWEAESDLATQVGCWVEREFTDRALNRERQLLEWRGAIMYLAQNGFTITIQKSDGQTGGQ